jgi:hypothetical protein
MKKLLNIILGISILFGFSQCGNGKDLTYKLQEEISFKVLDANYQSWIAGIRGGGSGLNVSFLASNLDLKDIDIDSLFFRGQIAKVEKKQTVYIARFKTNVNKVLDLIMHGETDAEYGNKPPIKESNFPFKLEDDEATVSYKEKGIQKYFKIKLNKKAPALYP